MSTTQANKTIDMRGKTITTYILYHAFMSLKDMNEGEIIEIITDHFEAIESDIKAWSRMTGHKIKNIEKSDSYERYYVVKNKQKKIEKRVAIVISSAGLEDLLSPLGFALGAALSGMDVYLYFQGPAVRVFKKGFKAKLSGFGRPFSSFARKGMAASGHISSQDKVMQLRELGAHFYLCGPSMDVFKVKKNELIFNDIVLAEYITFMEIMKDADIHLYP